MSQAVLQSPRMQGLYAIVDHPDPHGLSIEAVTAAVLADRLRGGSAGAAVVQLRAKHATTDQRVEMLETMAPLCRQANVPLFINDDLEAALRGPEILSGLHLGQGDPGADDLDRLRNEAARRGRPHLQIGLSTHSLPQLRAANAQRPDYLAFGPIAPTRSKQDPDPVVGLEGLLDACRLASRPLVAIGGIDRAIGVEAIVRGAAAVAVIGALQGPTPKAIENRARDLAEALRQAAEPLDLDQVAAAVPVLPVEQLEQLAAWADDVGMHIELGLPARFRPSAVDGVVRYRHSDVLDLMLALGKRPDESWEHWRKRAETGDVDGTLVQLRRG